MKKEFRVKKHSEFDRILHTGKKIKTPHYTTAYLPKSEEAARIGIAVSKKNGNAVNRVRMKRQVRAMIGRGFNIEESRYDIIIVIKPTYNPDEKKGNEEELLATLSQIKDTPIE